MTSHEWDPEVHVTPGLARTLVEEQFPHLAAAEVAFLAAGWENAVYAVGGKWAFRFPLRRSAVDTMAREVKLLPALAPELPLPIPAPLLTGEPSAGYPFPFSVSRLIAGRELASSGLSTADRCLAAGALGAFLRALHQPRLRDAFGRDLPLDPFCRGDAAQRLTWSLPWFERLAADEVWEPDEAVHAIYDDARRLPAPSGAGVIVHGDLHVRHLLVGADGAATGVIDWGDVCVADPAVDLAIAYAAFEGRSRIAFFDAYGPCSGEQEVRARVLAFSLSAALVDQARSDGSRELLAESLAALGRASR